ncbi:hypothetical protein MMC19_003200 [Ptychographa xylographoides]|nr:hypothetical protein [Ptychographa xylographoides]
MKRHELERKRRRLTDDLLQNPYDAELYLRRAEYHQGLGFPDLAVGDAYKALLLTDEAQDDSGEYHDRASESLCTRTETNVSVETYAISLALRSYKILISNLKACGCYRSAYDFCELGLGLRADDDFLKQQRACIISQHNAKAPASTFDPAELPEQGSVRRELYPWNGHEPDRFSSSSLSFLNEQLRKVAPKCSVVAVKLPLLTEKGTASLVDTTVTQLGIFAKEDIVPGETVLQESSILTANNRLHGSLCDACSSELPPISVVQNVYACVGCDDTVFCSETCLSDALETYHPAVCGKDVDTIGKDTKATEAGDALYLLLLGRVMALSETQDLHPLELKETKYIWGDFIPPSSNYLHVSTASNFTIAKHLPFSFNCNILSPLHILEKMDIDIYATLDRYDFWVFNTLYAKFRGTASARISKSDGRPEVCAVHPMWSLANHSCAPNVHWEWGGEIKFSARAGDQVIKWGMEIDNEKNERWKGGIRAGAEILNHYCDPELGVRGRREWAAGALGGMCVCERCIWEDRRESGMDK